MEPVAGQVAPPVARITARAGSTPSSVRTPSTRPSRTAIPVTRDAGPELDAVILQVAPEGLHDVRRVVGDGEDPAAALDLGLHPVPPEEGEEIVPEEAVEGAVEEPAVRAVHGDELVELPGVRQVAAALSADEDLLSRAIGLFEEENVRTPFRGPPGGHHPAGAGADDDHAAGIVLAGTLPAKRQRLLSAPFMLLPRRLPPR